VEYQCFGRRISSGSGRPEKEGSLSFRSSKCWELTFLPCVFIIPQKEAKRAAKLQAQAAQHPSGTAVSIPAIGAATTISQPQPLHAPARPSSTPKPGLGTPRPGSTIGSVSAAPGAGSNGGSRPISAVPRPGSATSKPATQSQGQLGTPVTTRTTLMEVDQQRGKKREREESTTVVNGAHANGLPGINGYMNGGANGISNGLPQQKQIPVALNSKAGTGNVRPRPIKKQRMVVNNFFSSPTHNV
jgi:hypothetical protein